MVAALKFRFNYCEQRDFSFKYFGKDSKNSNPHKAYTIAKIEEMYDKSDSLWMKAMIGFLYDAAARI